MAKTDNPVADGATPDAYPLSVEEFLSRLSQTDKRVELLGALLLAMPALPGWGFGAFALSNLAWLTASAWQRQWPLHAQQWVFLVCSLLGLWNWWLGPLLLG